MMWWWRKTAACLGAAILVGCATPPAPVAVLAHAEPSQPAAVRASVAPAQVSVADLQTPVAPPSTFTSNTPNLPHTVPAPAADVPTADAPWMQRGLASWYGKNFNGRRTASGERFSAMGLTAAHRTLPLPSYVRVRHVASGKEVVVRINDRGPFHSARVLDLSYAAAEKLGIVKQGSAEVEIERLQVDDNRNGALLRSELLTTAP